MQKDAIIKKLKEKGSRITRVRQALISVVAEATQPLTAGQILQKLGFGGLNTNKTTVYRELDFLENQKIVSKLHFSDGETRYEPASPEHHHHFFCLNCKKIDPVKLSDDVCAAATHASVRGFTVLGHSIEIYGLCAACRHPEQI